MLGKTLIGIGDALCVGAHAVSIVRHIDDGGIGGLRCCRCVALQATHQGGGETGGLLHVGIGTQPSGLVRILCVLQHLVSAVLVQGLYAAYLLLIGGVLTVCLLNDSYAARHGGGGCCRYSFGDA